jgi:hypothetical protein
MDTAAGARWTRADLETPVEESDTTVSHDMIERRKSLKFEG